MQIDSAGPDARVELLGHEGEGRHAVNDRNQLVIRIPELPGAARPCRHAYAFRLTGFKASLSRDARFNVPDAVHVPPGAVTLEGTRVRVQKKGGRPNIGAWDNPDDRCHWLVRLRRAGRWAVRGEFTSAYGPSGLVLRLAGQAQTARVPKTDGWFKPVWVDLGAVTVEKPGVYHLTLAPADPETWKAVNVWNLQLAPVE